MSNFAKIAAQVAANITTATAADSDAEWQRVNSYIADVLKDSHVLYAKLARLQGDFVGEEFERLSKISEAVLHIGDELSGFSKAFYEGKYDMAQSGFSYGTPSGGQAPQQAPAPQPQQAPAPAAPAPAPEASPEAAGPMAFGDSGEPEEAPAGKSDDESGEPPAEDYSGEEESDED